MTITHTHARIVSANEAASDISMNKEDTSEPRAKQVDWQAIISEWQASGLTKRDFCTRRSINYEHFIYRGSKKAKQQNHSSKLLPVKIANDTSSIGTFKTNHFTLHHPNGIRLSIPAQADKNTLKLILSCLGEV